MSANTAQILFGNPHPNDGGITPIHTITLTEGSRPALILHTNLRQPGVDGPHRVVWIPTLENMLDDALLLGAAYGFRNNDVRTKFDEYTGKLLDSRLEMYSDLNADQRADLYACCQKITNFPKVVVIIFEGSDLRHHIPALEKYTMECEVCLPVYSRSYSSWTQSTTIRGTLAADAQAPAPYL